MKPEIEREWLTAEEFGRALQLVLFEFEAGEHGMHARAEMWAHRTRPYGGASDLAVGYGWQGAVEARVKLMLGETYGSADGVVAFIEAARRHGFEPYFTDSGDEGYLVIAIGRNGQRRVPLRNAVEIDSA